MPCAYRKSYYHIWPKTWLMEVIRVIAVAAVRLRYIFIQTSSPNPTLVGAITGVLTQLELFYGIMAATIPCLRPFLAGFTTNYGAMGHDTVMG